jgi:hypothetical protein
MRLVLSLAAAAIIAAFVPNVSTKSATAAPLPAITSLDAAPSAVETVGWRRRYWRRYGVWAPAGPPPAVVEEDVIVDDDAVIIAPVRPRSCGQFHYWNGVACVDARYNDPYLGPK